jgi:two-component system response regulator WspF
MRIAIVNDLALAREVLRRLVQSVPGYSVAWMAENGEEAVRKAAQDRPDVILMDLVMPVMDGVEATRRIMAQGPCPILLVTSSVSSNLNKVYEAMGHGGLDAVNTPVLGPDGKVRDGEGLLDRLAKLARVDRAKPTTEHFLVLPEVLPGRAPSPRASGPGLAKVLALGASTGGPDALARILGALPARFPACVLIVQHIAAEFAPSLATWLQGYTTLTVRVAKEGAELAPGVAHLAATNDHLVVGPDGKLRYTPKPEDYPYRPSVDALFYSLAADASRRGVAVLLTGMGTDGAKGQAKLRKAGWHTIAQDQATSVVYGMPQAAAVLGAACQVLPLQEIAPAIRAQFGETV